MMHWKTALKLLLRLFLYSVIIILIDASIIFLLSLGVETFAYTLSLVILIEGGLGLIFGSVLAAYSPSAAKISEILFHSKPWKLNRQKENEKQMRAVIITAFILIIEALLVSAL
jgi:predicted membrane channel-forming protein YqfA (hemolysin III family)